MESSEKANKQPYSLINKGNGQVSPLPLTIENRKSNRVMTSDGDKFRPIAQIAGWNVPLSLMYTGDLSNSNV